MPWALYGCCIWQVSKTNLYTYYFLSSGDNKITRIRRFLQFTQKVQLITFLVSAHIFFSTYHAKHTKWPTLYGDIEDYWGNVFDPSEVPITVTLLNHRLHHVMVLKYHVEVFWYACHSELISSCTTFVSYNKLIHIFFIFPFRYWHDNV